MRDPGHPVPGSRSPGPDPVPPSFAVRWLEGRLPREVRDAISGDLQADYADRRASGKGRWSSDLWFLGQVVALRPRALRRAARRLAAVRPSLDRSPPGATNSDRTLLERVIPVHANDLKYAIRRLARSPGFTAVAVASLALGIGANTAMFSIVNAVLFRGLPVAEAHELVEVYTSESDGFEYSVSSHPDYLDMRNETTAFQSVIASRTTIARVDVNGEPQVAFGELISWDYFQTLGVPMHLGRSFVEEEDLTPGSHPVVILGYRTWQRDFGEDADILGRSLQVNGRPYTVVGIAPRAYTGSLPVMVSGFFAPLMMTDEIMGSGQLESRGSRSMFLKARLMPEVSVERANDELAALAASLAARYPESNENRSMTALNANAVSIHPAADRILGPVAFLLLAAVGVVLLIACANLASFLLARAEDRRKEIAIRLALGAARRRLVGQLLIETTLLALLGGAAGVALAHWTVGLLMALQPPLPIPVDFEISIDRTVLVFTAVVSLVAGLLFGLLPALQATNPDVAPTLKNEAVGGAPRRWNLRNAIVITQLAFSFVLLIGAGLFLRSLEKAQRIDPGFDVGAGAIVWPMPELSGYEEPEAVADFYRRFEERLLSDPVVTGVAQADRLPLGAGVQTAGFVIPGVPSESLDGDHDIDNAQVSPGYFDAMGVEIVNGRGFTSNDLEGESIAIVSEAFRNRFYPGESAVGRSIQNSSGESYRIVGVARDTKVRTLGESARPYVYQLHGQGGFFGMQVVVKGSGSSVELVAAARRALDEVSPDMVLFEGIKTMDEHLALLLFPPRMAALLLTVFGGLALLLAGIGIYGVVSYSVAKRTREVGIRMSLGASARDVTTMAVGGAMKLVGVGGVVGTVLAGAVTWSVSGYLFGISATDLATFVAIPMLLFAVALFAAWMPARRASSVDPVSALRSD